MTGENLLPALVALQDTEYQAFQRRLIPNIPPEAILGVRTPELRRLARELEDGEAFLAALPHTYFEENQVHAFLLEREKDFDKALAGVEAFLPYVDNWATCDQLSPRVFGKHRSALLPHIRRWIASPHTYTCRFGLGMLMRHFLDENFRPEYLELAASVRSTEYYVNKMIAWYFATALAKQYEAALPYIQERRLDTWCHNKAIQKAIESYRVPPERKAYLRTLKIR